MNSHNEIEEIYHQPLMDLVSRAHRIHRDHFDPSLIQGSQLFSLKTGGCPENCSYCSQSAHYKTRLPREKQFSRAQIVSAAEKAKQNGATRFCMGAAWREVKDGPEFEQVLEAVRSVKNLNLEVCCTLGMLTYQQAQRLKEAGLSAYNHNIDTSEEFYPEVITTRTFSDRLKTIENVRRVGLSVCTGGILGLGENDRDRISFLRTLSNLDPQPESVTVNTLVKMPGTPLEKVQTLNPTTLVRTIATARILMPHSMIRLSAGRQERLPLEQFLCFYVGANSIFLGEKLLTSQNLEISQDQEMFEYLNLKLKDSHVEL